MAEQNLWRSAPNLVLVCVDGILETAGISGHLYHSYSLEPSAFAQVGALWALMDAHFDHVGYPQRGVEERSFFEEGSPVRPAGPAQPRVNALADQRGARGTFLVHVMYRQNATWQGNVCWQETGLVRSFRSSQELLHMIDEAARRPAGS